MYLYHNIRPGLGQINTTYFSFVMPRQVPPVIPAIEPRDPNIIQPIPTLGPIDFPAPVTDGMGPVPGLTPPRPNVPFIPEPRIELPPILPGDIGEEEAADSKQPQDNEDPEDSPPQDNRDLPIDQQQFPTFNDPAYQVTPPDPTVEIPIIEFEVPVPDTAMLITTGTTAAVAAAGAVAATQAVKPIADFLIKQFKTAFKILFNKLLKKKQINYLDEKKFPRKKIELPARLRFEKGHPPLGQLRLGKDLRKEKKDEGKRRP
jgi:hypothetical protein